MSETNRLQAHGLAQMLLYFTCTIKGRWGFCGFVFRGKLYHRAYRWLAWGKARVVTEWKVANWEAWNGASRFGFEFWIVRREAKGERNETTGWHERNGMKEALLRGLPRLVADNERNGTEGGGTKWSPGV